MQEKFDFLDLFGDATDTLTLPAWTDLFRKGDKGDAMYIVKSGEFQVYDGAIVFETVGEGGLIGEMTVIDGAPRSASVMSVMSSEVIPVTEKRFLDMVRHKPEFALRMLRLLSHRLRRTTTELVKSLAD